MLLVSTDNGPTLKHWSDELGVTYPLLSDFAQRQASKDYGVLMEDRGIASRATFVVNTEGRITHIEEGGDAVDPTGALNACTRK